METYTAADWFHRVVALEGPFGRNCRKCHRRWLLCSYHTHPCDTVPCNNGFRTSTADHTHECRYARARHSYREIGAQKLRVASSYASYSVVRALSFPLCSSALRTRVVHNSMLPCRPSYTEVPLLYLDGKWCQKSCDHICTRWKLSSCMVDIPHLDDMSLCKNDHKLTSYHTPACNSQWGLCKSDVAHSGARSKQSSHKRNV